MCSTDRFFFVFDPDCFHNTFGYVSGGIVLLWMRVIHSTKQLSEVLLCAFVRKSDSRRNLNACGSTRLLGVRIGTPLLPPVERNGSTTRGWGTSAQQVVVPRTRRNTRDHESSPRLPLRPATAAVR